jgi:hypothetical protein
MRDRPRGVAVARRIDIWMKVSGVTGSEGTVFQVPFFIAFGRAAILKKTGDRKHGKMEQG